jgi:hypothetical protein
MRFQAYAGYVEIVKAEFEESLPVDPARLLSHTARMYFSRDHLADIHSIIGLSDGLTVPFALTAGLSSLGSSKLVVTGGLAELCAGAISMGLGGYRRSLPLKDFMESHSHLSRVTSRARSLPLPPSSNPSSSPPFLRWRDGT